MKKFSFSLDTVLSYKNQILGSLQNEHALILDEIQHQKMYIDSIKEQYVSYGQTLKDHQQRGITVMEIHTYENYLDVLLYRIKREQEVLEVLKKKEEVKRKQVIEAKKESTSIEGLREKKLEVYNRELQKQEEIMIEEFVSNSRNKSQYQLR